MKTIQKKSHLSITIYRYFQNVELNPHNKQAHLCTYQVHFTNTKFFANVQIETMSEHAKQLKLWLILGYVLALDFPKIMTLVHLCEAGSFADIAVELIDKLFNETYAAELSKLKYKAVHMLLIELRFFSKSWTTYLRGWHRPEKLQRASHVIQYIFYIRLYTERKTGREMKKGKSVCLWLILETQM